MTARPYDIEPGDLDGEELDLLVDAGIVCQNCGDAQCDGFSCYDFNLAEAEED
jgi:hypothetical protein